MKKFNLVILFILSVCIVTAQNLKPVVQKVTDAYSHTSSVTVSNMFKVEPASEARLANVQQAISKGTFLRFDKTEAQQIITNAPAVLSLILPNSHGNPYHLKLVKTKFTTADFQVTAASTGKPVEVDMGLHYQGIIDGDNNSIAAISFYKEEVMGLISSPTLGNVVLGKIENNFRSEHILYNDRDLLAASNFECSTLADNGTYTPAELTPQNTNRSSMINCVRLFWEVDNSIYTGKGGMTPTVNYITGLFNQHQIIYTNDGIPVELSELFVWDVVDPYTGTTSSSFLSQFQNYRNVINGDLGHLVGYGGGGGVADDITRGVVCHDYLCGHAVEGIPGGSDRGGDGVGGGVFHDIHDRLGGGAGVLIRGGASAGGACSPNIGHGNGVNGAHEFHILRRHVVFSGEVDLVLDQFSPRGIDAARGRCHRARRANGALIAGALVVGHLNGVAGLTDDERQDLSRAGRSFNRTAVDGSGINTRHIDIHPGAF